MSVFLAYGTIVLSPLLIVFGLIALVRGNVRKDPAALFIGWIGVLAGFALLLFDSFGSFWAVDSCLDSGGRFSYESNVCEFKSA